MDKPVYVVLEEDGTEVDEEEYFQTLPGEIPSLSRSGGSIGPEFGDLLKVLGSDPTALCS